MDIMDIIIIGSGPAGISAAIYAARANISFAIIERTYPGGKLAWIEKIENYPGFPDGISGTKLAEKFYSQALKRGANFIFQEVKSVKKSDNSFTIQTEIQTYQAKNIIVASGSIPKQLNIKGEDRFKGRGISYCVLCDGPLFRNKKVVVIGEGSMLESEINFLKQFSGSITWIKSPGSANTLINGITVIKGTPIEIKGENKVEEILVQTESDVIEVQTDGIFIFAGFKPSFEFLPSDIKRDKTEYIITNQNFLTSTNGIYACGDIRSGSMKQIVSAVYEGAAVINQIRKNL
ncbi:MAG TPA: FAD-dependent oxidoreductase [bacterium]|nr:FAD-dependent oxidoreductase [bacterium]